MKEKIIKILVDRQIRPEVAELTADEIMQVIETEPVIIKFDEDDLF